MKKNLTYLYLILALLTVLIESGCMTTNPDDQTVPWGRPADWEQSTPFYGG